MFANKREVFGIQLLVLNMGVCSKCDANIKNESVACDLCGTIFCKTCSRLTSTEMRALELTSRTLRFYCNDCAKRVEKCDGIFASDLEALLDCIAVKIQTVFEEKMVGVLDAVTELQAQIMAIKEENKNIAGVLVHSPVPGALGSQHKGSQVLKHKKNIHHQEDEHRNGKMRHKSEQTLQGGKTDSRTMDRIAAGTPNGSGANPTHGNSFRGQEEEQGEFTEVQRRRKRKKTTKVGTAENVASEGDIGEFEAKGQNSSEGKKIWLFISRAKDHVSEEIVRRYVSGKLNSSDGGDVVVKHLETKLKIKDNRCFLVGVDPIAKEKVYGNEFWPKGIRFDRFNFRRGQHFLESRESAA